MTPALRVPRRARAQSRKCGGSAWPGGKALPFQWRVAPTRIAHAVRQHASVPPARLRIMMSGPPLPTLALGRTRSPSCTERLEQRAAHDVFVVPTTKRQRAQVIGENTCRRLGAQRPRHGAERAARGRDRAAEGARPGRAARPRRRARSARRARRGAGRAGGAPVCALSIVTTGRLLPGSATLRS